MSIFVKKSQTSDKVSVVKNAHKLSTAQAYYGTNMKALVDGQLHSNDSIILNSIDDATKVFMRQDDNAYCSFLKQSMSLQPRELNTMEYIDESGIEHYTFERYNFIFTTYEAEELEAYYKQYKQEYYEYTGEEALDSPMPYLLFLGLAICTFNFSSAYSNKVETTGGTRCVKPWLTFDRNRTGPTGQVGTFTKYLVKYIIPDIYLTDLFNNKLPENPKHFIIDISELYNENEIYGSPSLDDMTSKAKLVYPSRKIWDDIWSSIDQNKKINYIQTDNRTDKGGTLMFFIFDD